MDEMTNENPRPVNPRRKKRSQTQIFKEAYLPVIIAGVALVLILIFVIGSISRGVAKRNADKAASKAAASSLAEEQQRLEAEAQDLLLRAEELAKGYNYAGAVGIIDSFSGKLDDYPTLKEKRQEYVDMQAQMKEWTDPGQVLNLSFQVLIADPASAFADSSYGSSYKKNFVTISEFSVILQQLYDKGYMLVEMDDIVTTNEAGEMVAKPLYLPAGKMPLMITQTNVNYYTYMVDSNGDGEPDKGGAGFASRLIVDENGQITCEMVDADGNTVTGAYDLVPLLDAFIAEHPDFSYNGAKAILAVTGYDGVFGYRTNAKVKETKGEDYYNGQVQGATEIINALREDGYVLACYTYSNLGYGTVGSVEAIKQDLESWSNEVTPILGQTDILVYAQNSDISEKGSAYSGASYTILKEAGFRYYLGFCDSGNPWALVNSDYIRQGRVMVSGSNLENNGSWFSNLFTVADILDSARQG